MSQTSAPVLHKSPLYQMTQTSPTCLWNDSAAIEELTYSMEHGAVGATCNPVIALSVLKMEMRSWADRIRQLATVEMATATEDEIGWRVIEEMSVKGAKLLEPIFEAQRGRNGRLSIQTDPRQYRNTQAILEQATRFSRLAPNMIVKIPATRAGIPAIEEATYRESASTRLSVSRCRNVSPLRRRSSAASAGASAKGKRSRRWDRCARSWSAGWMTG